MSKTTMFLIGAVVAFAVTSYFYTQKYVDPKVPITGVMDAVKGGN